MKLTIVLTAFFASCAVHGDDSVSSSYSSVQDASKNTFNSNPSNKIPAPVNLLSSSNAPSLLKPKNVNMESSATSNPVNQEGKSPNLYKDSQPSFQYDKSITAGSESKSKPLNLKITLDNENVPNKQSSSSISSNKKALMDGDKISYPSAIQNPSIPTNPNINRIANSNGMTNSNSMTITNGIANSNQVNVKTDPNPVAKVSNLGQNTYLKQIHVNHSNEFSKFNKSFESSSSFLSKSNDKPSLMQMSNNTSQLSESSKLNSDKNLYKIPDPSKKPSHSGSSNLESKPAPSQRFNLASNSNPTVNSVPSQAPNSVGNSNPVVKSVPSQALNLIGNSNPIVQPLPSQVPNSVGNSNPVVQPLPSQAPNPIGNSNPVVRPVPSQAPNSVGNSNPVVKPLPSQAPNSVKNPNPAVKPSSNVIPEVNINLTVNPVPIKSSNFEGNANPTINSIPSKRFNLEGNSNSAANPVTNKNSNLEGNSNPVVNSVPSKSSNPKGNFNPPVNPISGKSSNPNANSGPNPMSSGIANLVKPFNTSKISDSKGMSANTGKSSEPGNIFNPDFNSKNSQIPISNKMADSSEIASKLGRKASNQDPTFNSLTDEDAKSGHFMTYMVTFIVFVVIGYVAYHNRRKLVAYILEGKHKSQKRRVNGKEYKPLTKNLEEVITTSGDLEKPSESQKYIY